MSPDASTAAEPGANHPLPPYRLVADRETWNEALAHLQAQSRIGIDLEANSMFAYHERACLIQISSATADFIIDPLARIDLSGLGAIIADPAVEKVFHAAEYDLILLKNGYNWDLTNLFDTMWAARILGYTQVGLASLLAQFYGVNMSKRYQKSNWCMRPLTGPQLAYAQMDTYYLLNLRDVLARELEAKDAAEEAAEIFAEQARVRIPDNGFDPDHFWTMNGVYDMTPAEQATLRALYLFREEQAERRNLPPFKIMSDKTLMELAQTAPRTADELGRVFGMSPAQQQRFGRQVLGIIASARTAEPPVPPRRTKRPPDSVLNRYDRLQKWRKSRAQARGVESDVIISRDAMWKFAEANPRTIEDMAALGALGPWRLRTYGDEVLRALRNG
jgi:ribonuclease D